VAVPTYARLARGTVLSVAAKDYVEAARALGARDWAIIVRHVVPNVLAPLIVQTSLSLSGAILAEASLSFLGLGTQPPAPSWGTMLGTGRKYMETAPWVAVFPGLAITVTVLGFNLVGDGLRDALDPRLRGQCAVLPGCPPSEPGPSRRRPPCSPRGRARPRRSSASASSKS
jgi:peptide/nickel transport system permease protein